MRSKAKQSKSKQRKANESIAKQSNAQHSKAKQSTALWVYLGPVPSALPGLFNALAFPPLSAEEMAPSADSLSCMVMHAKTVPSIAHPLRDRKPSWLKVTARCRRVVRGRSRNEIRWPLCNRRAASEECTAGTTRTPNDKNQKTKTSCRRGAGLCWGFRGGALRYCGRHSHELHGPQRVGGTCSG